MLTHRRIQAPRPSIEAITTALIAASDEDARRLNEQELGDTLMLLITAGHETTAHLLDQAITALLTHPQVCGDVLAGDMRLATAADKQKLVAQHRRQRAPGIAGVSQVAAADRPPGRMDRPSPSTIQAMTLTAAGMTANMIEAARAPICLMPIE
ncbi:cytochrome P450 [Nocardia gipuzkoensis]